MRQDKRTSAAAVSYYVAVLLRSELTARQVRWAWGAFYEVGLARGRQLLPMCLSRLSVFQSTVSPPGCSVHTARVHIMLQIAGVHNVVVSANSRSWFHYTFVLRVRFAAICLAGRRRGQRTKRLNVECYMNKGELDGSVSRPHVVIRHGGAGRVFLCAIVYLNYRRSDDIRLRVARAMGISPTMSFEYHVQILKHYRGWCSVTEREKERAREREHVLAHQVFRTLALGSSLAVHTHPHST